MYILQAMKANILNYLFRVLFCYYSLSDYNFRVELKYCLIFYAPGTYLRSEWIKCESGKELILLLGDLSLQLSFRISVDAIPFHSFLFSSLTGPNKKPKNPDAFQIGFPMRTNYMYGRIKRTLLSEIFALTVCLWLKGGSGPGIGTPFSYSVPGQANELVLIEWGNNPMELLVNDKVKK